MSSKFRLRDMGALKRALPRISGPGSAHPLRRIAARLRARFAGSGKQRHIPGFPIERLPEELLAEVFSWVIAYCRQAALWDSYSFAFYGFDDEHASHPGQCPAAPYAWLKIRHVCRYWRKVALAHPRLSTTIFLTRPECVEDMLRRAGTLPLAVYDPSVRYIDTHSDSVAAARLMVLEHIARIRHGTFAYTDNPNAIDWPDFLTSQSHKTCTAQSLELLSMDDGYPAYSTLSTIHFPNLRKLSCFYYDVVVPGQLLDAPQLHTLHLVKCTTPISAPELLRLLGSLPALTSLSLILVLLETEDLPHLDSLFRHASLTSRTCALPHLAHLALCTCTAASGLSLLAHIAHPAHTSLDLRFSELSTGAHAACACVPAALAATCAAWAALEAPYASVAVTCPRRADDAFWLELWPAPSPSPTPTSHLRTHATRPHPFFRLGIHALHAHSLLFTHLLRCVPHAAHITSARLCTRRTGWSAGSWARILCALPALERLEVRCEVVGRGALGGRVRTLGDKRADKQGNTWAWADARAVCLSLRELRVEAARVPRWRWRAAREVRDAGGLAEVVRVLRAQRGDELDVGVVYC
ncbi:hypothetical protein PsYK624_053580 [Phanerochaete sordida]|uniref:F-box domain-containing protein n=1 Tax=Phanerochaete sordida TaxID=48140 RepID=A0A9P3LB99_9APHY|nr:hypothetical protein PsYK624_053580 [Phanerochaete sordida]